MMGKDIALSRDRRCIYNPSGGDLLGPIKKNIYLLRKVSVRPAIEKSLD